MCTSEVFFPMKASYRTFFFPLRYDVTWKHIWKRPRVCIIYNRRCMCVFERAYWCSVYSFFLRKNRAVAHTSGTGGGLSDINSRWQDYCFKVIKKKKKNPIARYGGKSAVRPKSIFRLFGPRNAVYISCTHIIYIYYYMRKCRVTRKFIIGRYTSSAQYRTPQ